MKKSTAHVQKPAALMLRALIVFAARLSRATTPLQTTKVGEHLTATWDDLYEILTATGHSELSRKLWISEKSNHCGWAKKSSSSPLKAKKLPFLVTAALLNV